MLPLPWSLDAAPALRAMSIRAEGLALCRFVLALLVSVHAGRDRG